MTDISKELIQSKIYSFRGVQVMLDKDLADFYQVKPIRLREQVKRNPNRFPSDFVFQLLEDEIEYLVSQNAIPSKKALGGTNPYVFTEQGVAALSGVLKSEQASNVSISIFRAFVQMRHILTNNNIILERLTHVEHKQLQFDSKINELMSALENNSLKKESGIFFEDQLFDAYIFICELIKKAEKSIVLIDNYIDESVFFLLNKRMEMCTATIYTSKINKELQLDLLKYNSQYNPIEVKILKNTHDRFLIIDNHELYHIGASIKDLGKKWFAFSKMNSLLPEILNKLE